MMIRVSYGMDKAMQTPEFKRIVVELCATATIHRDAVMARTPMDTDLDCRHAGRIMHGACMWSLDTTLAWGSPLATTRDIWAQALAERACVALGLPPWQSYIDSIESGAVMREYNDLEDRADQQAYIACTIMQHAVIYHCSRYVTRHLTEDGLLRVVADYADQFFKEDKIR